MAKQKMKRYREVVNFENVSDFSGFRPGDRAEQAGKWASEVFGNDNPVVLELACGKGDYALGLAKLNPDVNYIGIDIKGERIWKGAGDALEQGLENVRFIRGRISYLDRFFAEAEVSEIWITFPDPFLKFRRRTRRLTHPRFLGLYKKVLSPGAPVHLKTDSPELYEFTRDTITRENLELISDHADVYALNPVPLWLQIRTYYEHMHLAEGRTIRYLKFRVDNLKP
jgi:tRNA (guanine-N7-)-methyltransferase